MGNRQKKPQSKVPRVESYYSFAILGAKGVGKTTFVSLVTQNAVAPPLIGRPGQMVLSEKFKSQTCRFEIANLHDCLIDKDFLHYLENLSIPLTRIFILCFAVDDRRSFDDEVPRLCAYVQGIKDKCKELHASLKKPVFILVGMKSDLEERCVSKEEAQGFAEKKQWGYIEISTIKEKNLVELFETIIITST